MSYQVGSACYVSLDDAGVASCAAMVSTPTVAGQYLVTSSCAGQAAGVLTVNVDAVPVAPSTIFTSTSGFFLSRDLGVAPCAGVSQYNVSLGSPWIETGCAVSSDGAVVTWTEQYGAGGSSYPQTATRQAAVSTRSVVQITPSYQPCVLQNDVVEAIEVVIPVALLAWLGWYSVYRINKMITWGRGEAS